MNDPRFTIVGIKETPQKPEVRTRRKKGFPVISVIILAAIVLCCLAAEVIMTRDPAYMDLYNADRAPGGDFIFGTDSLGRDIFSGIWYGGRISIMIGVLATAISTLIAVVYGAVSGLAPRWLDALLMRLVEVFLSVPGLLLVLFLQAILGEASVLTLSLVIGVTGWAGMAKIVRTEVRQMRSHEYILAARSYGGGFFHILRVHLAPNFFSAIMFMIVMCARGAISSESTLSFMGMGLPLETISWGSMLSLVEGSLLTGSWWVILIPGAFLAAFMMCLTNIANYMRRSSVKKESNL